MDNSFFDQAVDPHCIMSLHPTQNGVWANSSWRFPRYFSTTVHWPDFIYAFNSNGIKNYHFAIEFSLSEMPSRDRVLFGNQMALGEGRFMLVLSSKGKIQVQDESSWSGMVEHPISGTGKHTVMIKIAESSGRIMIDGVEYAVSVSRTAPILTIAFSNFPGTISSILLESDSGTLWQPLYSDLTTPYKYKDFSLPSNAIAFTDARTAVTEKLDVTHDYKFVITFELGENAIEKSIFYAGAQNFLFGIYSYTNFSINVFTNLVSDPNATYATIPIYSGNAKLSGQHTAEARIVGNTYSAYLDGTLIATKTNRTRVENPFIGLPQCNSGYIYSLTITDLTTNEVVYSCPMETLRALPCPNPEYKVYDLRKNFKDNEYTMFLSSSIPNYTDAFKFIITFDIDDYTGGIYNIFGDEFNFPILIQTFPIDSNGRLDVYSIDADENGEPMYHTIGNFSGVNGHHHFVIEYDGNGTLIVSDNEAIRTATVSFATITNLISKIQIGKNYSIEWQTSTGTPIWVAGVAATCNAVRFDELYQAFKESTSGWMLVCRFSADFSNTNAAQTIFRPLLASCGYYIEYANKTLIVRYRPKINTTDGTVILVSVQTNGIFNDAVISIQRYGTTLFTYAWVDGQGIGSDTRTVPANDLMLYTRMGDSYYSQFSGILNSVEYRERRYGYKGLTMYDKVKFPSPGERGGMLTKTNARADRGAFEGISGYKTFTSQYTWSTEPDGISSIGEHDCSFVIRYQLNGYIFGLNNIFYHNSQSGSVNLSFYYGEGGVVTANYSYLKLTNIDGIVIPTDNISAIGNHEIVVQRTGTAVQVTFDGEVVLTNTSGTAKTPVYSTTAPITQMGGNIEYVYWKDIDENKIVWQNKSTEVRTRLAAKVSTALNLKNVVSSYTAIVDFEASDFDGDTTTNGYQVLIGQGSATWDSTHRPVCAISYYHSGATFSLQFAQEVNNTRHTVKVNLPAKLTGRHIVAGVVDLTGTSTILTLYLDCIKIGSATINAYPTGSVPNGADSYTLWPASTGVLYYGKIYSAMLYDIAMSQDEIIGKVRKMSYGTITYPYYLAEQVMYRFTENAIINFNPGTYALSAGTTMRNAPGQTFIGSGKSETVLNTALWLDRSSVLRNLTCNAVQLCTYGEEQSYVEEAKLIAENVKSAMTVGFRARSAVGGSFTVNYEVMEFENCESTNTYYLGGYGSVAYDCVVNKAYFKFKDGNASNNLVLGPDNYTGATMQYKDYVAEVSGFNYNGETAGNKTIYIGGYQAKQESSSIRHIMIDKGLCNIANVKVSNLIATPYILNGKYTCGDLEVNLSGADITNSIWLCGVGNQYSGIARSLSVGNITVKVDVSDLITTCNAIQWFNTSNSANWQDSLTVTGEIRLILTGKGSNLIPKNLDGGMLLQGGLRPTTFEHPMAVLEFDTFIAHQFDCAFRQIDKYVFTNYNDIVITREQDPTYQNATVWEFNPPASAKSGYVYNAVRGSKEFLTGFDSASKIIDGVEAVKSADNIYSTDKWELEVINQNILQLRRLQSIYEYIQQTVRNGNAATEFGIGYQFETATPRWTITWEAVGFDQVVAADSSLTHTMTLLAVKAIQNLQFDASENGDFSYGNARWGESNIRQWLNSNKEAGSWFTPVSDTDTAPDYASTLDGFMYDLPSEFIDIVAKAKVTTALSSYFNYGQEVTEDYFWLPSYTEMSGNSNNVKEGVQMTKYVGTANAAKVKYNASNTAVQWWMRSPSVSVSGIAPSYVRLITSGGSVNGSQLANYTTMWVVPACIIA